MQRTVKSTPRYLQRSALVRRKVVPMFVGDRICRLTYQTNLVKSFIAIFSDKQVPGRAPALRYGSRKFPQGCTWRCPRVAAGVCVACFGHAVGRMVAWTIRVGMKQSGLKIKMECVCVSELLWSYGSGWECKYGDCSKHTVFQPSR